MSVSNITDPPKPWYRPRPDTHPQLFGESVENVLASMHVSRDDLRRWSELRWISFEIDELQELQQPLVWEIDFVQMLARSGLSDAQINEMLVHLDKPYRFNPDLVVYHFGFGWVSPMQHDPDDVVDDHLDEWLETLAESEDFRRLQRIHDRISELLENRLEQTDN